MYLISRYRGFAIRDHTADQIKTKKQLRTSCFLVLKLFFANCYCLLTTNFRCPKVFFKIDDLVVAYFDAFVFEELLHEVGAIKMVFAG